MNQPLTDSTFISSEPETFTLTGSGSGSRAVEGGMGISGSSFSNSNNTLSNDLIRNTYTTSTSSNDRQQIITTGRYSSAAESVTGSYSASSSIHSTPTKQPYQYKQSSSSSPSGAVSSSTPSKDKDYFSPPSASSSPAKSCLVDSSHRGDHENELRHSLVQSGAGAAAEDEDELAFGNPTEIRSTTAVTSSTVAPITGGVIVNPLTGLAEYSNPPTPARHRRVSFDLDFSDKEEKSSSRSRNKDENVGKF